MGNMKHNIKQIEVLIAIALQRPGENPLEFDKGTFIQKSKIK